MSYKMNVMISEEELHKRIKELGEKISEDYRGQDLLLVAILKGSLPFLCELMHNIDNELMEFDTMCVSSYENERESTGVVKILKDVDVSIRGRNVLIVEDIVDTGRTIEKLTNMLKIKEPNSVKICTLLNKPSRRVCDVKIDYVGFEIENRFVAGFGLDYDQKLRQLRYIGEMVEVK